jgi:hypothetical protein
MPESRFPPPRSIEDIDAAFAVKDSTGQALAYVYFEDEPGRRESGNGDSWTSYDLDLAGSPTF